MSWSLDVHRCMGAWYYRLVITPPKAPDPFPVLPDWGDAFDWPEAVHEYAQALEAWVERNPDDANAEFARRLVATFKGLLESMQCREEVREHPHYLGGRLGLNGVAHQNGTVRFGNDPTTSVLDINCKAHEVDNLYVVDSGFFVSSSAVNPTLTIIANALRVADHLKERLT